MLIIKGIQTIEFKGKSADGNDDYVCMIATIKFRNNPNYAICVTQICKVSGYEICHDFMIKNLNGIDIIKKSENLQEDITSKTYKNNLENMFSVRDWNSFITQNASEKINERLLPMYYLKIKAKEKLQSCKSKASIKFVDNIISKTNHGDKILLHCIVEYCVVKKGITDINKLLSVLNHINKENLQTISNSSNSLLYKQIQKKIDNIGNDDVPDIIEPLVETLKEQQFNYDTIYLEECNKIKNKAYKISDTIKEENYVCYNTENKEEKCNYYAYFYENGLVIVFNDNTDNLKYEYNFCNVQYKDEIKQLANKNLTLFIELCSKLLYGNAITVDIISTFGGREPKFEFQNAKLGKVKFYMQDNDDDAIVECDKLEFGDYKPEITIPEFDDDEIDLYMETLKKINEMKNEVIDELLNFALSMCINWEEKDGNGNTYTIESVRNDLGIVSIFITSSYDDLKSNYSSADAISFSFHAYMDNEMNDYVLRWS